MSVVFREMKREEIDQIWKIDRGELVDSVYRFDNGTLAEVIINVEYDGWTQKTRQSYDQELKECFDRGGDFVGGFDGDKLVAVVVIGSTFLEDHEKQLQVKFMHVDRKYRKNGLGRALFERAVENAKKRGANHLYIVSCESKNTVDFYTHMGCKLVEEPHRDLFAPQSRDIHLMYTIQ